jgi:hypothetical protein
MTVQTTSTESRAPWYRRKGVWVVVGGVVLLVAIGAIALIEGDGDQGSSLRRRSSAEATAGPSTSAPPATQSTAPPATAPPTTAPPAGFAGTGTFVVGRASPAGVYVSVNNSGCFWERSSAASAGTGTVIASDNVVGQALVQLQPDEVFKTTGCTQFVPYEPPLELLPTFADGTWAAPSQVAPGRWQAPGGPGCYWARLSDLSGSVGSILASETFDGPLLVDLDGTEAAFTSKNCGDWTPAN